MTDLPTAEQAPPAPLALVPVPGLQAIGGDAVGFCGPDGCYPADLGQPPAETGEPSTETGGPPAAPVPTDRVR